MRDIKGIGRWFLLRLLAWERKREEEDYDPYAEPFGEIVHIPGLPSPSEVRKWRSNYEDSFRKVK